MPKQKHIAEQRSVSTLQQAVFTREAILHTATFLPRRQPREREIFVPSNTSTKQDAENSRSCCRTNKENEQ